MVKEEILATVHQIIQQKINQLETLIEDTRKSNNETKSSMGDKYETGREMIQQEINRLQNQLQVFVNQKDILKKIGHQESHKVEVGSLVETDKGWFYISVSLGEFQYNNRKIFAISPESPLAQSMHHKTEGESFSVNQIKQTIKTIF